MRTQRSLIAAVLGLLLVACPTPSHGTRSAFADDGGERLTLFDLVDARSGEARLRAVTPRGSVMFERSAVWIELARGGEPLRMRIDFPASPGFVTLEAQRERVIAGDTGGRGWSERAAAYREVRYRGIAPGTDLVFRSRSGRPASSVIVESGASLAAVRLRYRGVRVLTIDSSGRLEIHTATGIVTAGAPVFHQERHGERQVVAGGYRIIGQNELGFWAGAYDDNLPLIVDPELDEFGP